LAAAVCSRTALISSGCRHSGDGSAMCFNTTHFPSHDRSGKHRVWRKGPVKTQSTVSGPGTRAGISTRRAGIPLSEKYLRGPKAARSLRSCAYWEADLLLLDEPFSALDHPTRLHMGHCLGQVMRSSEHPGPVGNPRSRRGCYDCHQDVYPVSEAAFISRECPMKIIKNPSSDSVRHLIQRPGFNQVLTAYPGHVEGR